LGNWLGPSIPGSVADVPPLDIGVLMTMLFIKTDFAFSCTDDHFMICSSFGMSH
jgi:hypothetical protein